MLVVRERRTVAVRTFQRPTVDSNSVSRTRAPEYAARVVWARRCARRSGRLSSTG
jgi:hypothetical protein